jgi:hypothetical protein
MAIHFDDRGKYFTDVISKEELAVTIQTVTHRVEGSIHVRIGARLKDELNGSDQFIAVTAARIYDPQGEQVYQSDFMALNRDQVVWVMPNQAPQAGEQADGGGA